MKQYFLIIFSQASDAARTKLSNFFKIARQIFPNVFVCELENDEITSCEDVRSKLLSEHDVMLMVIRLDADFSSAWYLREDSNNYLKLIFTSIHHGTEQAEQ